MKTVVLGRWACGWTFFLLFHFLYCGYSILFCEIKRNHGVYIQLNSDSAAEWGIWETSMLVSGLGQYRVSTLCSAWGKGCSEKPQDLSKAVWGYQATDRMRLQAPLLKSPGPSCLPWPLIPRSLPSLGNSVLLNKTKREHLLPALCESDHLHLFTDHLHPFHLHCRLKPQPKPSKSESPGLKYLNVNFTRCPGNSLGMGIIENH